MANRKGSRERLEERRRIAFKLRTAGKTYEAISKAIAAEFDEPKYDKSRAWKDIQHSFGELARLRLEDTLQYRDLELARLDELQAALWVQAKQGKVGAIDRVLAIMQHRARLLGLEAPVQLQVDAKVEVVVEQLLNVAQQALQPTEFEKLLQAISSHAPGNELN